MSLRDTTPATLDTGSQRPPRRWRRRLRRLVYLTAVLIIAIVLGLLGVSQTGWFRDWLRRDIIVRAERLLDAKVSIAGVGGDLLSGIVLDGVRLEQAGAPIITIDRVRVTYRVLTLRRTHIVLDSIDVLRPVVVARQTPEGWTIARLVKPRVKPTGSAPVVFAIDALRIFDGRVAVEPLAPGKPTRIEDLDASLAISTGPAGARVEMRAVSMTLPDRALRIGRVVGTVEKHGDVVSITNTGLDLPRSHLRVDGNMHGVERGLGPGVQGQLRRVRLRRDGAADPVGPGAAGAGQLQRQRARAAVEAGHGDRLQVAGRGRRRRRRRRPRGGRSGAADGVPRHARARAHRSRRLEQHARRGGPRHRTRRVHVRATGRQPRPAGARDVHADAHRRQRRRIRGPRRRGPRALRRSARHAAAGPRPGLRRPVRCARHDRAARSRREGRPLRSDRPRRRHRRPAPAAAGAPPAPGDRRGGHLPRHARRPAIRRDDDVRRVDRRGRPRPRRLDRHVRPGARRDPLRGQGPPRGPRPGTARRGVRRRLAAGSACRRPDDGRRGRAGAGPHARRNCR